MKHVIIIFSIAAIAVTVFLVSRPKTPKVTVYTNDQPISRNVSTADDVQIIDITAKGGYAPATTTAKAGVATRIRVKTNATFDCSSALRIPSIGYSKNLPPSGTTDIDLPAQDAGTTLTALCSMGMYRFSISFKG